MVCGEAPPGKSGALCGACPQERQQLARKMMVAKRISRQSMKNREYVRRLLREKQPEFAGALELAMNLVRREPRSREIQRHVRASEVS